MMNFLKLLRKVWQNMIVQNSNKIGYYKSSDGSVVITHFNITSKCYETLIKDKELTNGILVTRDTYGMNLDKASKGHLKWQETITDINKRMEYIERLKPNFSIKISLQILCRILYEWTDRNNRLFLHKCVDNFNIYMSIESGVGNGFCFYDLIKKEANSLSEGWAIAIQNKIADNKKPENEKTRS